MDISVKEDILNRLKENKTFRRASLDEYCMRCMICGDSKKDPNKRRLYVKINTNDESPIVYHCHNCGSSGYLTSDVLREFNIYDLSLNSRLTAFNKEASGKVRKNYSILDKKLRVKVPKVRYSSRAEDKKRYIETRLGVDLTFEELVNMKCIFSLRDFVETNKIEELTIGMTRANMINDDYVGFLSINNEYINFRDITDSHKLRYDKYTIIRDLPDTVKMCAIPTSVQMLTTEPIIINIAEGVFDILGLYYNVMNKKTDNMIYVAVCGSGYMNVIKYFIKMGFIGNNITINIFSDSDKDPYFYKKVIAYSKQWVGKINLIYNILEKDYGVPRDKIKLRYQNL